MFMTSPQSCIATDPPVYPLYLSIDQLQPQGQEFPEMDYFVMDTSSQFFLDPDYSFDPSMVEFPDMDIAQTQVGIWGEPIETGSGQQSKLKSRVRASRACIACRSRHMKCDSVKPVCTRCQVYDKTCVYTKSRRGGSHKAPAIAEPKTLSQAQSQSPGSDGRTPNTDNDCVSKISWETTSNHRISVPVSLAISPVELKIKMNDVDLIATYYEFFNNAHPVVLPRNQLQARLRSNPASLEHLMPVMKYIGSVYLPDVPSEPYLAFAEKALSSSTLPADGFSVQALILFALARHCSDEYGVAEKYIDRAIDIALALGMNQLDFALTTGEGDVVLQESWRRTWWFLFTLDGLFATISHYCTHRLQYTSMNVDLPYEDVEYESGFISMPHTFAQYDAREFLEQEITFSSLTYLLDSIRILSHSMTIIRSPHEPGDKAVTAADAKLVNWQMYLPPCKKEMVRLDGSVDETMFLAHLIVKTEFLLLHRPTSHLPYSALEKRSICTPTTSLSTSRQSKSIAQSLTMHTARAIEALEASITSFALPGSNIKHSPLATCALALAVMAQVSACGWYKGYRRWGDVGLSMMVDIGRDSEKAYVEGRDRVRLGLGALRAGMKIWGLANRSVGEVIGVARELLLGNDNRIESERCSDTGNVGSVERGSDPEVVVR
ncbi:uncharacterized protein RAG0_08964 [Rhynchosporium agropyri]|uniref:Zn(2)-C6 fungal-type domain-containing protein n=1 Tax=Rhynchosporium agropyri TaxID=914238 RepID=A0A1E1KT68_9HELO|nr:uncharacterized protein RAG0_08964 [Rhynchosporium agropyri]